MAKKYIVKVYNKSGSYLNTWDEVVSDIEFQNEINTAGGQMKITLARKAGDYGEGSDIDFGYKIVVNLKDKEYTDGKTIFQGFISSYTPIYKDDRVEVIVLGYGAELNDYVVEAGDVTYISQLTQNTNYTIGHIDRGVDKSIGQTFTIPDTSKIVNSLDLYISSTSTNYINLDIYIGVLGTKVGSGSAYVPIGTNIVKVIFNTPITLVKNTTYFMHILSDSVLSVYASSSNPYANGNAYTLLLNVNRYEVESNLTGVDLYFNLYSYGGSTKKTYTSQEPTSVLTSIIDNYNSRGGILTEPPSPLNADIKQEISTVTLGPYTWSFAVAQIIKPTKTRTYNFLQAKGSASNIQIVRGDPSLDLISAISGKYEYTLGAGNTVIWTYDYYDTKADISNGIYAKLFGQSFTLNAGVQYYILFYGSDISGTITGFETATSTDNISDTQVGRLFWGWSTNNSSGSMGYSSSYQALYFRLGYSDTLPEQANGGYTSTGSTLTYTVNTQSVLEVINVIKDLSPSGYYWYVNQGENYIQFKKKSDLPKHTFSLNKDILDAKFEKRIEGIINTIYFTGGDTGSGTNLFKKYTKSDSIEKYGVKSVKYNDTRVISTVTSDAIANNILASNSEPELRVTLEVLDSNNEQGLGYDIESIQVGDTVAVRNITQQVGLSVWDVGRWDDAYFDFNIYNLSSLNMQVQRIEYKQDRAILYASTIPTDINKRIEEINRGIDQVQTFKNPTTPS